MSGGKAAFYQNRSLDMILGGPTVARPSTLYFQATSTVPTASTPGTALLSRVAIPNDSVHFPAAVAGAKSNGLTVDLGSTAGMMGLTILGAEIWDTASGGNRYYWGTVASTDISDSTDIAFAPGAIVFTET